MSTRKVKYKPNEYILPCPKCGNNTEFLIHSEQVMEDGCEIWAECKCGHTPAESWRDRIEDVWGGCSDENCQDAINTTWNDLLNVGQSAQVSDTTGDDSSNSVD
jgi:ssDNA-binding Zn-finger/Zn-ribbon topoisomerase 1